MPCTNDLADYGRCPTSNYHLSPDAIGFCKWFEYRLENGENILVAAAE
jgi:hypothetical protein